MCLSKIIAFSIISSILLQPLGLVAPVFADTVDMEYSDPEHIHAPKVVNGVTYEYDANGNLTFDGERRIEWNQDNLPVRIEKGGQVVEFFYDANGRRIVKQIGQEGANRTVYVNQYYEQLTMDNEQSSAKYYFANGRVAVRNTPSGGTPTLTYLHQDHLGSTVLATDTNSQSLSLSNSLSYFPYGSSISNQQLAISNYLFTGQELDDEASLYNYNARLYNPKTGAFISADTLGGGNRYAYAANNPMMFTDPTGHQPAYDPGVGGGGGRSPDDVLQYEISGGGVGQPGITATTPINPTVGTNPSPSQLYFTQQDYEFWMRFMSDFGAITMGITTLAIGVPAWLQFAYAFYYYKYFYYNPADLVEIGPGLGSTQATLTMGGQSLIETAGAGAVEAVKTGEITDRLRVWGEVKQGDNAYLDESMGVLEDLAHKGGIRAGYGEPGDAMWEGVKRELQQALTQEPMSGAVVNLPGGSDRLHIKVLPTGEIRVMLLEYLSLPETVARFREIFGGKEFFIK